MHFQRLEVSKLRNLTSVSLHPGMRINLLYGANGSGKTSLLEAIHLLCLARSFRSIRTSHIVQHGEQSLTLFAELSSPKGVVHRLGLQRSMDNRILIRLDSHNLRSRAELASLVPLLILTPDSSQLVSGSPRQRRSFIDWLMFHVEPAFQTHWSAYQKTLKQRNSLLRSRRTETLAYWDQQLLLHGDKIDQMRKVVLPELAVYIEKHISQLLPELELAIDYRQGWNKDISFEQALEGHRQRELQQGTTSVGPHRCDLKLSIDKQPAAEVLSRGQTKLLVVAMHMGQMELLARKTAKQCVVLIDDLPAELDSAHRQGLLGLLHEQGHQVFITATDRELIDISAWQETKVFHVERGQIKEVV